MIVYKIYKMFKSLLYIFVLLIAFNSCKSTPNQENNIVTPNAEESADVNKVWITKEHKLIDKFIERNGWDVKESGTGLRYTIYDEGKGDEINSGDQVMIDFTITLLDGTECYSTKDTEPVPFVVDKDNVESGLHEGVSLMKVGDKAKLIIPSYLAHGLAGDLNKIPMQSTVIYDIKVLGALSN